jgi:hypothetical protein
MPIIALLINVLVNPHIDLCFFTSAFSTATVKVPGSGKANCTKDIMGTEVDPSGPFTATEEEEGVSVTLGGILIGSLPI